MTETRPIYAAPEPIPVRVGSFYAFADTHHLIVGEEGKPCIEVPDAALAPLSDLAGRLARDAREP